MSMRAVLRLMRAHRFSEESAETDLARHRIVGACSAQKAQPAAPPGASCPAVPP